MTFNISISNTKDFLIFHKGKVVENSTLENPIERLIATVSVSNNGHLVKIQDFVSPNIHKDNYIEYKNAFEEIMKQITEFMKTK
jgi:hypothetical protein